MEKVISIQELRYEKMYKDFYEKNYIEFSWFHSDTVKKVKIS